MREKILDSGQRTERIVWVRTGSGCYERPVRNKNDGDKMLRRITRCKEIDVEAFDSPWRKTT